MNEYYMAREAVVFYDKLIGFYAPAPFNLYYFGRFVQYQDDTIPWVGLVVIYK